MSAVVTVSRVDGPNWRPAAMALAVLLALILILYRDTAGAMVAIWERSNTFAHAFIVPPIALWLVWRRRAELMAVQPRTSPWVLSIMAFLSAFWLLGELANVNAVTQLALVGMLVTTVPLFAGWSATRTILFPLGFLFFSVPIGDFMMPPMMVWTADFTVLALRVVGIPVYREAQQIVIPTGTWSVVEACSGIRFLIASMMVGTLFAYLNYRSLSRRVAFVALSILVPIVGNWIRAFLIVLIGHLSNNRLAVGVDHLIYGWVFFGLLMLTMFMVGGRWTEPLATAEPTLLANHHLGLTQRNYWSAAAAAVALVVLPQWAVRGLEGPESFAPVVLPSLNATAVGWRRSDHSVANWRPAFMGAEAELVSDYVSDDGREVGAYLGYYRHQDAGRKLVSSENLIVRSSDRQWLQVASGSASPVINGRGVTFRTARLLPRSADGPTGDAGLTVWQVYWINGRLTSSDAAAKLLTALYRLVGRGDDGAVLMFYSRQPEAIAYFLRSNLAPIEAQLERVRAAAQEPGTRKEVRR